MNIPVILRSIKKSDYKSLRDVCAILDVSDQFIQDWRSDVTSTQSKGFFKHCVIIRASELLSLCQVESEKLANKAGLSLYWVAPEINKCPYKNGYECHRKSRSDKTNRKDPDDLCKKPPNKEFSKYFCYMLKAYPASNKYLWGIATHISESVFYSIRRGEHLKKESILALLIAMGVNLDEIQKILSKADFTLSDSIPRDKVIKYLLEEEACNISYDFLCRTKKRLHKINEELEMLGVPLLKPRDKKDS